MATKHILGPDEFTENDQLLIELSARGASHADIAEQCGCTIRTVARRIGFPKIKQAIRLWCRESFQTKLRQAQTDWDKVRKTFVDILDDPDADTYQKIASATQIKAICFHAQEMDFEDDMEDLRSRIMILEQRTRGGVAVIGQDEDDDDQPEN